MIELTTGVIFLMSSLYGNGQADNHVDNISTNISAKEEVVDMDIGTLTSNPKGMEEYLRKEFADAPILVDIARCESNFKQFDSNGDIIRGRVDSDDLGVMQINKRYQGATAEKLGMDLYTTEGNIAYAKHLYEEQGVKPWASSEKCWGGLATNFR